MEYSFVMYLLLYYHKEYVEREYLKRLRYKDMCDEDMFLVVHEITSNILESEYYTNMVLNKKLKHKEVVDIFVLNHTMLN